MDRYKNIIKKAKSGEIVLMDGATGTEVLRRGVKLLENAWAGGAALTAPEILQDIHEEYIKCGAKIIISNTFANAKHALADAGEAHNFSSLNDAGVRLCVQARNNSARQDVLVAGGISYWSWTGNFPKSSELENSIKKQAMIMKTAGADLIMLEMMVDIEKMLITIDAAKTADLPIWVGLTCQPNSTGNMCLRTGDDLNKTMEALILKKPNVINIMHTEVQHIAPALKIVKSYWDGLVGVYAHASNIMNADGSIKVNFEKNLISPKSYKYFVNQWRDIGINFVGGCCGINMDHITLLAETMDG